MGINNRFHMHNQLLLGWIDQIQSFWHRLDCPSINHIFRENNTWADRLSKMGLVAEFGSMNVSHFVDGRLIAEQSIPLP